MRKDSSAWWTSSEAAPHEPEVQRGSAGASIRPQRRQEQDESFQDLAQDLRLMVRRRLES